MALEILINTGNAASPSFAPLDITDDVCFTIDYEIANIQDISNSGGAYTKSLSIPATARNRQLLGYVTNMSTNLGYNYYNGAVNSFNPNKRIECYVLENTIEILHGYFQLTDFDKIVGENDMLNITIYADNGSFYISMGDSLITDIDFSEYNFTYSQAIIQSTWTNSNTAYRGGIYFNLQDDGNGWTLDELNNGLYTLSVADFKPAVYVKTIWDKIFATYSYNVASKFCGGNKSNSNVADPRFGNLIIPFTQQAFQTGPLFNQDKIFHVGMTQTTIGQYTNYSMGTYSTGVNNMVASGKVGYAWYDGYLMSPWQDNYYRNSGTISNAWTTFQIEIPFGNTASPMFNTYNSISGAPTYDYSTFDPTYQNTTNGIFKQRFVMKTDIVTLYSNNGNFVHLGQDTPDYMKYTIAINFYREIDPLTGTTSTDWLGGTGALIPPDLGFQVSGNTYSIATNSNYFWICDDQGKSNCFDVNGTLIIPTGDNRYLGKYSTTQQGDNVVSDNTATAYYQNASGNCISWYYNDGYNGTFSIQQQGLWISGNVPSFNNNEANEPCNGDWYQQLQLQSIYLDGNKNDPYYGTTGSVCPKGNTPIQPGEKVRCVVFFNSKYSGLVPSLTGYRPPVAGYLLTYTNFAGDAPYPYGKYQNPVQNNTPLTQWYNDVSNDYIDGQLVNFNDVIPKNTKQRDFIQDIVHLHNLYIEPLNNYPNTLIIEPREMYYQLATQSLDWSNKLDISQPINVQVLAETQNKRTVFTYKDDKDYYNKLYTQNSNQVYGQFINQIDNDFLTGETSIESIFSPTPISSLYSVFANNGGDSLASTGAFVLPVYVNGANVQPSSNNGPNGAIQINYRLLYKNYIANQNSDTLLLFGKDTHYYPYAGPYDNPYNPQYTINWGQTLGEMFDGTTDKFSANLVNTYWAGLLTEMTDMDSRIITCSMFLTPLDIYQFQFFKLVFLTIDGVDGYYKVNSIEGYTPGMNTICKVTLLRSNTFLTPNTYSGSIG